MPAGNPENAYDPSFPTVAEYQLSDARIDAYVVPPARFTPCGYVTFPEITAVATGTREGGGASVGEGDPDADGLGDADGEGEAEGFGEADADGLGDPDDEGEAEGSGDADADGRGVAEGEGEGLGLADAEGRGPEAVGLGLADTDVVGLAPTDELAGGVGDVCA